MYLSKEQTEAVQRNKAPFIKTHHCEGSDTFDIIVYADEACTLPLGIIATFENTRGGIWVRSQSKSGAHIYEWGEQIKHLLPKEEAA